MANGDGDGDDDEQRADSTIYAEVSRQDTCYDCGLRISPRLPYLIPTLAYAWH